MTLKEQHGLSGRLHITLREGGRVVGERLVDNLITTAGRQVLALLFAGQAQADEIRVAVGTNAAVLDAASASITQVDEAKATVTVDEGSDGRARARVVATLPASGDANPQPIQEAGIVIVLPDRPVVYNRVTFPVVNRAGNLEMTFSWEVSF